MDSPETTKPRVTAKDFFLYLAALVALYASAGSWVALLFSIINTAFPDRLDYYVDPFSGSIRFAISMLVIIVPLYLFLSWYNRRQITRNPEKAGLWVRTWSVYLTLFLSGIALIGDLVALVNTFLGGEIATRFVLKALSVLIIAGAIFSYYLYDLVRTKRGDRRTQTWLVWVVVVGLVFSLVGGFLVAGSPEEQRELRFDQERVSDLQSIQLEIVNFWQSKERIPEQLVELDDELRGFRVPSDPETDSPYEYRTAGKLEFELCATFDRESKDNYGPRVLRPLEYSEGIGDVSWAHDSGRQCFIRTIDPDFFPPRVEKL